MNINSKRKKTIISREKKIKVDKKKKDNNNLTKITSFIYFVGLRVLTKQYYFGLKHKKK